MLDIQLFSKSIKAKSFWLLTIDEISLKFCFKVRMASVGLTSDSVIDEEDPLSANVSEDIRKLNVEAKAGEEKTISVGPGKMLCSTEAVIFGINHSFSGFLVIARDDDDDNDDDEGKIDETARDRGVATSVGRGDFIINVLVNLLNESVTFFSLLASKSTGVLDEILTMVSVKGDLFVGWLKDERDGE